MREARRHVEDIAGLEHPFLLRFEVRKQPQPVMRQQRRAVVAPFADTPAPSAQPLDEEHIVLIEMRPHPAAIRSIAHHDVVDPPIGNEAERFDQFGHLGHVMVDSLDEQRPGTIAQSGEAVRREGALFQFPSTRRGMPYEAGFDLRLACETRQLVRFERVGPIGPSLSDKQRAPLPGLVEETLRIESKGGFHFRRASTA